MPYDPTEKHNILIRWKVPTQLLTNTLDFYKSCHDIRRTYISRLLDSGINPDTVRRIAGHEDIEMTMKYCRGCEERHELEAILEQAFSN